MEHRRTFQTRKANRHDSSVIISNKIDYVPGHTICSAATSEQTAYVRSILGNSENRNGEDPDCYVESYISRHDACKTMWEDDDSSSSSRLSLTLLGASRQTYEEANRILWTTNTFTFKDLFDLSKFVGALNFAQRKIMTKVLLRLRWSSYNQFHLFKPISKRVMKNICGVQHLDLCLEVDEAADRWLLTLDAEHMESRLSPLLPFQQLPLKRVRVTVTDGEYSWKKRNEDYLANHKVQFSLLEKRRIASYCEDRLLGDAGNTDVIMGVARKLEVEQQVREAHSGMMMEE